MESVDGVHLETAARERRRKGRIAVVRVVAAVVVLSVAYSMIPIERSFNSSAIARGLVAIVLTLGVVIWQILIAMSGRTPDEWIERLVIAVPLVMFGFATSYLFLSEANVDAFSEELGHLDAVYFSLMTMTTVGFGDISAVSEAARAFVVAHMVATVVIVGLAIHLVRRGLEEVRSRGAEGRPQAD